MTQDEFDGHLMAALHGPNADKIAARVLEVFGIGQFGELLGEHLGEIEATLDALAMHAFASGKLGVGAGLTPRQRLAMGDMRDLAEQELAKRLESLLERDDT